MSVSHSPAPARSDVTSATTAAASRPFVRHGAVLSAGALAWAAAMAVVGIDPVGATEEAVFSLASGLFQVGLLCLLRVLWVTRALGEGRLARGVLRFEAVLVLFLIGIRVAIAGRWKGVTRFWPMVAESWAVVVIPVMGIFGDAAAAVVAPLHLVVGYTVLGVLVSRKQG
jgi:hypothetical protein